MMFPSKMWGHGHSETISVDNVRNEDFSTRDDLEVGEEGEVHPSRF